MVRQDAMPTYAAACEMSSTTVAIQMTSNMSALDVICSWARRHPVLQHLPVLSLMKTSGTDIVAPNLLDGDIGYAGFWTTKHLTNSLAS
eukprot:5131496-Amphidinium_carterae.2